MNDAVPQKKNSGRKNFLVTAGALLFGFFSLRFSFFKKSSPADVSADRTRNTRSKLSVQPNPLAVKRISRDPSSKSVAADVNSGGRKNV